jgi:hypothetical protein
VIANHKRRRTGGAIAICNADRDIQRGCAWAWLVRAPVAPSVALK